jgi:hypothetical protein
MPSHIVEILTKKTISCYCPFRNHTENTATIVQYLYVLPILLQLAALPAHHGAVLLQSAVQLPLQPPIVPQQLLTHAGFLPLVVSHPLFAAAGRTVGIMDE